MGRPWCVQASLRSDCSTSATAARPFSIGGRCFALRPGWRAASRWMLAGHEPRRPCRRRSAPARVAQRVAAPARRWARAVFAAVVGFALDGLRRLAVQLGAHAAAARCCFIDGWPSRPWRALETSALLVGAIAWALRDLLLRGLVLGVLGVAQDSRDAAGARASRGSPCRRETFWIFSVSSMQPELVRGRLRRLWIRFSANLRRSSLTLFGRELRRPPRARAPSSVWLGHLSWIVTQRAARGSARWRCG